jgi:4-hydroxy-tetrahydrodipicolinate synthase
MIAIRGVCPVLAVPFSDEGALDVDGFISVVEHVVGSGVSVVTLFGLASEFHKLTDAERERLVAALVERTRSNANVAAVISVTDHATEVAVERARTYVAAGADALMLLPPFFLGPSAAAIIAHVEEVLAAVSVPVIAQYAPVQTGVRIDAEVWASLHEARSNLALIKVEAQPPGPYVSAIAAASSGALGSLVGYAGVQLPDALRRGAIGVQPGCSFTEIYVELMRLWDTGDAAGFNLLHRRLLPFISYWMQGVELIVQAEKSILARRGLIAGDYCRRPGYVMDGEERLMIDRFLDEFADFLPTT